MILTIALSVLVGVSLGLLGGGGSILTLPILLYAAHMEPKSAIAVSLLVVGATSALALIPHARAGHVKWRTGLTFGVAAMAGAFGGGWVARFIPPWILLISFTGMMLVTAVAMLRGRRQSEEEDVERAPQSMAMIAAEGIIVGGITGMVGAGGGFLVVPALAVLGGLKMRDAIGTSLMVIAMKSLAGFAGYVSHVSIDYTLATFVIAAASVGAVLGAIAARRVSQQALRLGFGWFVVVMGLYMLGKQIPASVIESGWFQSVFVERWPWYAGGLAIGALVLTLLYFENKLLGVSTGYSEVCSLRRDPSCRRSWRMPLLGGIVLGGLASSLIAGRSPTTSLESFGTLVSQNPLIGLGILFGGGMLVGFGSRAAGGCTSGHSIVGVAQGARSSIMATAAFMIAGFAVTYFVTLLTGN